MREKLLVNEEITQPVVRLIASNGEQLGVKPLEQALVVAREQDLDLVEIAPNSSPPVCKILDYGKHVFNYKKSRSVAKKKAKQVQVKEIKIRPNTGQGDYEIKLRNVRRFIEGGDKVKISLRFKGREISYQEFGLDMMNRIKLDTADITQVENDAKIEGRQMVMVLMPKPKK